MVDQIQASKEQISLSRPSGHSEETQFHQELAALSWALSQSLDLDRVLELALESSLRVVGGQVGSIHVAADTGTSDLRLRVQTGLPANFAQCIEVIPLDDPEVQRIIASREAVISERCGAPPKLISGDEQDSNRSAPGTWVCVPLLARDRFHGLLSVLIKRFTPDSARLLEAIGQHLGVAIENSVLFQTVQQDADRLGREAQRWHALNQAAVSVGSARSEQEVYGTVTHALTRLGFSAAILAFDPITRELTVASVDTPLPRTVRAIERMTGFSLKSHQIPFDRFEFCRRVIEQGQSELFELGTEYLAQLLPSSLTHLAPRLVKRAGLEYGIAAPLRVNERAVGVLIAARETLASEDIPAITAFADQASAAIENARLIQAERRQREVAETLRDLVVTVNSTLDVNQVLDITVRRLQTLHQATACSVSFLEERGETFVFRATTDPGIDVSQRTTFPASGSIASRALHERAVQVVDDVRLSPDHQDEIARRTGVETRSLLTAPLFAEDKPLGVIQVLSASPHAFTQADAELLASTAALIETAIARAQAYAHAVQLARAEHQQREVAETLRQVAILVSASLDLDDVLDRILGQLAQVVEYDSTSLMLVEGDKLSMRAVRGFEEADHQVLAIVSDIADNPLFQEMEVSRRPILIPDVSADDRYQHWTGTPGVDSWIGVPLVVRDQVIGQLTVDKHRPNFYDEDDAELVLAFAQHAATAVENARLYQAERDRRQELEVVQRASLSLTSSLDLPRVLDSILDAALDLVSTQNAHIFLYAEDRITFGAALWEDGRRGGPVAEPRPDGLTYSVARQGETIVVPDMRTHPLYANVPSDWNWVGSIVGLPLKIGRRVVGVMNVSRPAPGPFSKAELRVLRLLADHAAIAIENARLFEAEQRQRRMAEALHQAALTLTSTIALDQVFERILAELQNVVPYDSASVQLLKEDQLEIIGGRGFPNLAELLGVSFPARGDNPNSMVLESREPVIIDDVSPHYPAFGAEPHSAAGIHGWLGVPLVFGDQVIGMLALDKNEPDFYNEAHARIAKAYAAQAAIAIENARLYEEERERLAEMERRTRELAALHAVAAAVSSSPDTDVVLGEALTQALEITEMEAGGIYLLNDAEDALELRVQHNLSSELPTEVSRLKGDEGLPRWILQTGEPSATEDLVNDPQLIPRTFVEEAGYRSLVMAPLRSQGRIQGVLFAVNRQPRQFPSKDLSLLTAIADEMGVAVQNARLHQALQDYATDLEARVEARAAELNREHERLLAVLENAGEAIAIADAEGIIEYANPAWENLTGHDVTQDIQHKTRILDQESFPDLLVTVRNPAQLQRVWRREIIGQRPDGTPYVIDLNVTPVFDDTKTLVNLIAIYRDVTQYKELDRIKSEFLSTAAHELRSPLTSILGFSELLLLREDLSDEEQGRFLNYINEHAIHLKQLVSDLLDISRIESGARFAVNVASLNLYPILEEEIQSWQEAYPEHNFQLQASRDVPQVRADRDRISQVMRNLLSNATKYSTGGSTVTVSATPVGGFVEVTVSDRGIGMSSEELAHIFEKFWRADASSTAAEGTGLGLVIVRHIVEQHGGQIWVESDKGRGTAVHFTLPVAERQTTVLIAEDEDSVREIEHRILTHNGMATLLASDGQEAIELAQAHRPDLILLDLMMPGMRGEEVLRALKSNPATQHIPVLVVSALSSLQTIDESYMLGATDFLTKPFEYQELLSRVRRALKSSAANRQAAARNNH